MRRRKAGQPQAPAFYAGSCRGKVGYTSKRQASGALRVALRDGIADRPELMGVYHCRICVKWHMGHAFRGRRES